MKRLSQQQMDSENGLIYGRAPVPGARFHVDGVYYDTRGFECVLPGQKAKAPKPEPEPEPEPELTESQARIAQFKDYLDGFTTDDQKDELIAWARDNLDVKMHPNTGLPKAKAKALEAFIAAEEAAEKAAEKEGKQGEEE